MTHTLLRMLIVGFILPSFAFSQSTETITTKIKKSKIIDEKTDELDLKLKSQYLSQESELSKTNRFQARFEVVFNKEILPSFRFEFETAFNLENGQSDELYENANEFTPENNMTFRKGEFVWNPLEYKYLNAYAKAGAIKLKHSEGRDLLIGPNVYLGVSEHLDLNYKNYFAELSAYQTGPRNINTSNRLDRVDEGDPRFFMESLTIGYDPDYKSSYSDNYIKLNYSQFAFTDLSTSVAATSYLQGNTVNLQDKSNGQFQYAYKGNTAGASGNLRIYNFGIGARSETVINNSAPRNNQANLVGGYLSFYSGDSRFTLGLENFKTQADATVAYYSNAIYRRTNVEGQKISFDYENRLSELEVGFDWVRAEDIFDSNLTKDSSEDIVVLFIRKSYEIF